MRVMRMWDECEWGRIRASGGLVWFLGFHGTLAAYCLLEQLLMSTESLCYLWLLSVLCGWTVQCLCSCELEMTWKKIVDYFKVPSEWIFYGLSWGTTSGSYCILFKVPSQKVVDRLRYHLEKMWFVRYHLGKLWAVWGTIWESWLFEGTVVESCGMFKVPPRKIVVDYFKVPPG